MTVFGSDKMKQYFGVNFALIWKAVNTFTMLNTFQIT